MIDPRRTDLAQEFKQRPFGPHSPGLQAVLNVLRGSQHCQNLLLVCTRPHAEWMLAEKQRARLGALALDEGLALYSRRTSKGKFGDWVMMAPPLIIDAAQVDELVTLLERAIRAFERSL